MANNDLPDYKALFLEAERKQKQAEERQKQAEERRKQEEERRKQEEERRKQAEERRKQAEERRKQAEEEQRREAGLRRQAEEQTRPTTFGELIQYGHNIVAKSLRVEHQSRCTSGNISAPIGKKCPRKLRPWTECQTQQEKIYRSVCKYFGSTQQTTLQLFPSLNALESDGRKVKKRPISSEQDLESYERSAVEDHVRDIITELCNIPAARGEFHLGDGVQFDNHANSLETQSKQPSRSGSSRPDQFCIHRVDNGAKSLLTSVEYKPPHKLSVESLRNGLRSMNFLEKVVKARDVPTTEEEKSERIAGAVIAQEFDVMIQEGLEYSYVTNGLALVLLRVPLEDPGTLYYHLCEPNLEVNPEDDQRFLQPTTAIARVLCLCLMSFCSRLRDQQWRNEELPIWKSSFDDSRTPVSEDELPPNTPGSKQTYPSPKSTTSEYLLPSSSSAESPTAEGRRVPTRSQPGCAPPNTSHHDNPSDSDSDVEASARQKRGFSEINSSPPVQRVVRQAGSRHISGSQHGQHNARFCTQHCLLGLQQGGLFDDACPNVMLHKQGGDSGRHIIDSTTLVQLVKQQLDENVDRNCTPMGGCGASGAPFRLTCAAYGYTVVGKGTTSYRWPELLREADVYRVLRQAQGSAVPVFLGAINMAKTYFLHGAGAIRHMLLMAWGGESISNIEHHEDLPRAILKSKEEIRSFGVLHLDLRPDNILWNAELGRALIIDFHCAKLDLKRKRMRPQKRLSCGAEARGPKRRRTICQ